MPATTMAPGNSPSLGGDWRVRTGQTPAHVVVQLKANAMPAHIRKCQMPRDAKQETAPHIECLRGLGILVPCQFAWNTPCTDYRFIQDLRKISRKEIFITLFPIHIPFLALPHLNESSLQC